jgi:hypothetical protein
VDPSKPPADRQALWRETRQLLGLVLAGILVLAAVVALLAR